VKKFFILTALIFTYLIYGLYLAQYDLTIIPENLNPDPPVGFHDYKGVTNVHSSLSTGSGEIPEIIDAAQTAGLDYISITDLNIFDKPLTFAGYHNNLLVFIDGEYSYLNTRLLNIHASTDRHLKGVGRSQVLFAELLSQPEKEKDLGLLVLAHPLKPRYHWTGEYPVGLDGIEVINLKSVWQSAWMKDKLSFAWSLIIFPFNPRLAMLRLFRAPEEEVRLWDELSQKHHTIGIAGADADAKLALVGTSYLQYPSYQTLFSLVHNHVLLRSELTGNYISDSDKIGAAMRLGQFYMSLDILGDPKGFNTVIIDSKGKSYPMGTRIEMQDGLKLQINLANKPDVPFDAVIFKNGERMLTSNSQVTQFFIHSPGVYRVMVRVIPTLPLPDGKKWIPWIYTNPIYVLPEGTRTDQSESGTT
jgi:hypothetical protein